MNIIFWGVVLILVFLIGYYFGKEAQKEKDFGLDPDNDSKLSDNDVAMLLFTKEERYELGKAKALGTKKEIKIAEEKLREKKLIVLDMKHRAILDDMNI